MNVENALYPGPAGIAAIMADSQPGAVVMVNLLKFRDKAKYAGRSDDVSGIEAYERYVVEMRKIIENAGGRFLFAGGVRGVIVGEVEEAWDVIGLIEYPSMAEFRRIASSPEVQAIGVHREAGLAGQLLIATIAR